MCRAWQLLAQPFIFRSIKLRNPLKLGKREPPDFSLERSYAFLADKPRICLYVRSLSISKIGAAAPAYYVVDMALLWRTVSLLERLETLSLAHVLLELKPESSLPLPLRTKVSLQELKLAALAFSGIEAHQGFYFLLRMCTSVNHLNASYFNRGWESIDALTPEADEENEEEEDDVANDVLLSDIEEDDITSGAPYPAMERMTFNVDTRTGFWNRKQFTDMIAASANLRSVSLRTYRLHGVVTTTIILRHLPSNLRDLKLFIGVDPPSRYVSMPHLRTFVILPNESTHDLLFPFPSAYDGTFSALAATLTKFTCLHAFSILGYPCDNCHDKQDAQTCMDVLSMILMSLPPTIVHLTFAVLFVLDRGAVSWDGIRAACRRFEVIQSISIYFSSDTMFNNWSGNDQKYYQNIISWEMKEFADRGALYLDKECTCTHS